MLQTKFRGDMSSGSGEENVEGVLTNIGMAAI